MPTVEYLNYDVVEEQGWDVDDPEIFERAAELDLDEEDYGEFEVYEDEHILEAAERHGYDWPFACRAGSCANCAAILVEGEMRMDTNQILTQEEIDDKDVRLTCVGTPLSDHLRLVYNAKHIDYLQDRVI